MDCLNVACKTGGCIWRGTMGEWRDHLCPSHDYATKSVAELHQMMMHDERVVVKTAVIARVGLLLCAEGSPQKRLDLLLLLFSYMKKFRVYEEILEPACKAILAVCERPGGPQFVEASCPEMWRFLFTECNGAGPLRPLVARIGKCYDSDSNAAEALGMIGRGYVPE